MKNWYQIARLAAALLAVAVGAVYLWRGSETLLFVLPLMCLCFWAISALSICEGRASGARGFAAYLPAAAGALVAVFATVGMVVYFASL